MQRGVNMHIISSSPSTYFHSNEHPANPLPIKENVLLRIKGMCWIACLSLPTVGALCRSKINPNSGWSWPPDMLLCPGRHSHNGIALPSERRNTS